MKTALVPLSLLAFLCLALQAPALDRKATTIDWLALDLSALEDADIIGGSIWCETAIGMPRNDWALLVGGGMGSISPDAAGSFDYWHVGGGLKFYPLTLTSIAAIGDFTRADNDAETELKTGTVILKQRFVRSEDPVSPFVQGSIGVRDRDRFSGSEDLDSVSETVMTVGGGLDFNMREDFVIGIEAAYSFADDTPDDAESLDGWVGQLVMKYFWF